MANQAEGRIKNGHKIREKDKGENLKRIRNQKKRKESR